MAGFTLLELLLVAGLTAAVFAIGIPVYQSFQAANDLEVALNIVSRSLRRAQILSEGAIGDLTWGVNVVSGEVVIFQGENYQERFQENDEVFQISKSIQTAGELEIVFSKSGGTTTPARMTFTLPSGSSRVLDINEKGAIFY